MIKQEKTTKHTTDTDFQKLNLWAVIRNLNDERGQSPEKNSNKKENKKSIDSGSKKQDIPVAAEEKTEKDTMQMVDFKPITQNPK